MSCIIVMTVGFFIVGFLVVALAFVVKDNDYLKASSDSQGRSFEALNKTVEAQSKYIAKLEAEIQSKRDDA